MQDKYGRRGLSIVGVTGGYKENTEQWVKLRKVRYAYAYDADFELAGPFNVFDLPFAVLVDATGNVAYAGHPSGLNEEMIRAALPGAVPVPMFDWPAETQEIRTAILADDLLAARTLAGRGAESRAAGSSTAESGPAESRTTDATSSTVSMQDVTRWVEQLIENRVRAAEATYRAGDWLGATERCESIVRVVAGGPLAERVKNVQEAMAGSETTRRLIQAQKDVRSVATRGFQTLHDGEHVIEDLEALKKAHPDTIVSREVDARLGFLKRCLEGLR